MLKTLFLGLLASTICGYLYAAPLQPVVNQLNINNSTSNTTSKPPPPPSDPASPQEDPTARSERSTNFSHVTGTARLIQMFIKNRHLQLLPDGIVNGTTDDSSLYTFLQRTSVGIGQMKIQGVATCQFLCMDSCGLLYASREFGDECVFRETLEQHNYNTYSSSKYSNQRRTLYLALNRRGQPKKVLLKAQQQLGRLSSYTRVLTYRVSTERAEELQLPLMRHHGPICPNPPHQTHQSQKTTDPPRCRKRRKRKKKKRKCTDLEDLDHELCQKRQSASHPHRAQQQKPHKCDDVTDSNRDSDECQRDVTNKKNNKHKTNISDKPLVSVQKKKKKIKKGVRKRVDVEVAASTEAATTTPTSTTALDDNTPDEDYGAESSTHIDWEESTVLPDVSMAVNEVKSSAQPNLDSD